MVNFPVLFDAVPTADRYGIEKPSRDRAWPISPFTAEIAASHPEVAAAAAKLDEAIEAIRAEVDRLSDLVDEYEAYQESARAGEAERYLPDEYFQRRADQIQAAHVAAVRAAVVAQNNLVKAARPYEDAFLAADRKRIREIANELAVLIDRSTHWTADAVVVRGFEKIASVRMIIEAIRHIGTFSPLGQPYGSSDE